MEKITTILKELGFEEREIQIYLFLLKNNESTALQISKETHIDRTTTYDLLEKMNHKRTIRILTKNNTKKFIAASPNQLLSQLEEKYTTFKNILPDLNNLTKQTQEKIISETFQGPEGLKIVLKDFIETKSDYKIIGIKPEYEQALGYFVEQGIIKLNHLNIKEEALIEEGLNVKKLKNSTHKKMPKEFHTNNTTILYKDTVLFITWNQPYTALRIKNKTFYQSQLDYFNYLWNKN